MDLTAFKKTILPVCICLIMTTISLKAQSPTLQDLKEKFRSGKVFHSDFDQSETISYTGETTYNQGEIWVSNNAYKVRLDGRVILVKGDSTQNYEEDRNRLLISEYNAAESEFAPSRLLEGSEEYYESSEKEVSEGTEVTLNVLDEFSELTQVVIVLDFQLRPVRIRTVDFSDNVTEITFNTGEFIDLTEDIFTIDVPESAEIIDLRE